MENVNFMRTVVKDSLAVSVVPNAAPGLSMLKSSDKLPLHVVENLRQMIREIVSELSV